MFLGETSVLAVVFVLRSNTDEVNAGSGSAKPFCSCSFIYFCQHFSDNISPDQSNNMSADFLNGFPPSKPVKKEPEMQIFGAENVDLCCGQTGSGIVSNVVLEHAC